MWREWRAGALLSLCARRRKSAPLLELHRRHSLPQAIVVGLGRRSSAKDPLFLVGVFVQLTGPLHHSGRRKSPLPVPASSRLRSHAQISMTLSKWGGGGGDGSKGAGAGTQHYVLSAPTPPAKLTSAHSATGSRTRSKSPHEPLGPAGHTGLSQEVVRREAGRKEESDLQSHTSCLHTSLKRGRDARWCLRCLSPRPVQLVPSPQGNQDPSVPITDAMTPRLRH